MILSFDEKSVYLMLSQHFVDPTVRVLYHLLHTGAVDDIGEGKQGGDNLELPDT